MAKGEAASPRLVELFVSQNCPACPGAMATVAAEAEGREDIFVLTWSIDYWNYLGWKDTFAQPEFTDRQKDYADKLQLRGPFTPMLVVDGADYCAGSKPEKVEKLMNTVRFPTRSGVSLTASGSGTWTATQAGNATPVSLTLVEYTPGFVDVIPASGPNRKRAISHQNVVVGVSSPAFRQGPHGSREISFSCATTCALIVARTDTGAVLDVMPGLTGR